MKVLVCGGRDYRDAQVLFFELNRLNNENGFDEVIVGDASGADFLALVWAAWCEIPTHVYRAKWNTHGKKAGPMRNQEMLDKGKPDLVVAFPGGRGTSDMVRRARKAGIEVREIARPAS